jgi:hypothetical protein
LGYEKLMLGGHGHTCRLKAAFRLRNPIDCGQFSPAANFNF